MMDLAERLLAFITRIENAAHQNVAFHMIGILLQDFLRHPLRFSDQLRLPLGAGDVVVAKLYACIKIFTVELSSLAQLSEGFLKTLESLVSTRQTPVSRSK